MNLGIETRIERNMVYKFFFTIMFACLLTLANQASCFATTVTLQWDANTDTDLAGYKVYYQADSSTTPFQGTGATPTTVLKPATTATISGLTSAHAYYFAVTAYNTAGVESAYSNLVYVPELQPPTVTFTLPSTYSLLTVPITTFTATDNVLATGFCITLTNSSTGCTWNGTAPASVTFPSTGSQTAYAWAKDAAGNISSPVSRSVTITPDTTPPTVSITAPVSSATVSGTATITATATDTGGISKIEFYLDSSTTPIYTTNVTPYSYSWNTTSVANGSHTIYAKAYDTALNMKQSSTIAVTVSNPTAAVMSSPTLASTLAGSSATFTWSNVSANLYQVWVGTSPGAYNIGAFPNAGTTATTTTATGLPTNGSTIYVRLWAKFGSSWIYNDYTYTASGSIGPATMLAPVNASALAGASQTFTWNNAGANLYQVWVGTSPGTFNIGAFPTGGTTATNTTATGLPVNGATLYVRLWSRLGTTWSFNDYTYTASGSIGSATMFTPVNGATIGGLSVAGSSVPFIWSNAGANLYQVWVGTSPGTFNIGAFPTGGTTATNTTATGLPAFTTGTTIFVRLWSRFGTTWVSNDYTYSSGP